VARFFAPIDYIAAAPIVNWLGRYYRGNEPEMCEAIIELKNSGEALQERLLNEFNYYNLYRKSSMATNRYATAFGWEANERSVFDLWHRTKPHIAYAKWVRTVKCKQSAANEREHERAGRCPACLFRVKFIAYDRYLVDREMRVCDEDPKKMTSKAEAGFHDDVLRATQLAVYAAHDWQSYGELDDAAFDKPPEASKGDYQHRDITREEMIAEINERLDTRVGDVY